MENLPALPEGEPRPGTVGDEQMEVDQIGREEQGDRTARKISKGIVTGNAKQFLAILAIDSVILCSVAQLGY